MTRRADLPPTLSGRAFAVGDARAAGVPWRRLDGLDLRAPFRGARTPVAGTDLEALVAVLTPDQAFTGPTAAKIWGMPLPRRLEDDPRFWVSTRSRDRSMRRPGVVASRRTSGAVLRRSGFPVLDPARTWFSLASMLHVHDLASAADRVVTTSPNFRRLLTAAELVDAVQTVGARRGAAAAQTALQEMRVGSWSRPESLLRIALMRSGLPEPVLNQPQPVAHRRFSHPDLAWPELMVCAEYDGLWHDDPERRAADLERHELLVDAGWLVVHIRSGDLFPSPGVAVARILRRLTSRGYSHHGSIESALLPSFVP